MYNPELSDIDNAIAIDVSPRHISKWRKLQGHPKVSKKYLIDKKIADMYDHELSDSDNAKVIGVSCERIREWRQENNIKYPSKKDRTDKKIAALYNPDLSDSDNAKVIGVSRERIREWRQKNKIKPNKLKRRYSECVQKRLDIFEKIGSLYNVELSDRENAKIIGVKPHMIHEWRKENQDVIEILLNINDEDWKAIEEFPDYMVSRFGQVYSKRANRILQPLNNIDGYICYALTKDKKRKNVNVNRLVAEAFIPNPENKTTVIYIDGDYTNNIWTNLKWGYRGDSDRFMTARGNGDNAVKVNQYTLDGEFVASYNGYSEAARITHIDRGGISKCCRGIQTLSGGYVWKLDSSADNLAKASRNKKRCENMFNNVKKVRGKYVIGKKVEVNQYKPNGEFVARYDSIINAQRHTNIYACAIGQCCLGKLKSTGGYVWKYADAIE
jgi:DNA-binding transcriptional regulator YiaG